MSAVLAGSRTALLPLLGPDPEAQARAISDHMLTHAPVFATVTVPPVLDLAIDDSLEDL